MYSYIWIFFPRSCAMIRQDKKKIYHFTQTVRKWKRDKITRFWYVPKCVLVHVDFLSAQDTRNIYQIIYSLPLVIVPSQLDVFFMKIHILMKELWKSIKGNIFKIFLLIHYNFSHEKNHRNKTVLLQRFISGMLTSFLH